MTIWSDISVDYKIHLRLIGSSMTGLKYRDDILHPIVIAMGALGEEFTFIDFIQLES